MSAQEELATELEKQRRHYWRCGQVNYFVVYAVYLAAVLTSFAATALVILGTPHHALTAVISALPGMLLLLNGSIKFEAKSRWHFDKTRGIDKLARSLKYEGLPVAKVSELLTSLHEDATKRWPGFGLMPGDNAKPPATP